LRCPLVSSSHEKSTCDVFYIINMAESEAQEVGLSFGGYDEEFINAVEDDLQCTICHLPLKDPMLTKCGHRCCKKCLDEHFKRLEVNNESLYCPVDRNTLIRDKDVFGDKATERKILSLVIKCPSEGCSWMGELRNKEIHLASCNFKLISCSNENCEMKVSRKDLEEHATKKCQWRTVDCDHCHELYPECQMELHIKNCKKFPVQCSDCELEMQQEELPDHIQNNCPRTVIQCPYYYIGCNVEVQRGKVDFHLESAAKVHLDLACVKLNKNNEEFQEVTKRLEAKIDALEKQVEEKWNFQQQSMKDLSVKLNREVLKLKEEPPPFVWKISGFNRLFKSAKKGINTDVESSPFFTGPVGYKLCVSIYPNGYGDGKNTHFSVYICLLKGKYDAILPWPFTKTVTFTLIDQQENELNANNFAMFFTPNPANASFARPVQDCNDEWGFCRFISHEQLRSRRYIVDDTLFLKVQCTSPD
ncbi:unnamed protein product, partial [Porites evermanni]